MCEVKMTTKLKFVRAHLDVKIRQLLVFACAHFHRNVLNTLNLSNALSIADS